MGEGRKKEQGIGHPVFKEILFAVFGVQGQPRKKGKKRFGAAGGKDQQRVKWGEEEVGKEEEERICEESSKYNNIEEKALVYRLEKYFFMKILRWYAKRKVFARIFEMYFHFIISGE